MFLGLLGPDLLRTGDGRHRGRDDGAHLLGGLARVERKRGKVLLSRSRFTSILAR
jgi:hypothetical protein